MKIQPPLSHPMLRQPAPDSGWAKALLVILAMCLVQFFGAWLYPNYEFGNAVLNSQAKPMGVPFQYMVWVLILVMTFRFVQRHGVAPVVEVLKPFMPFLLVGLLASAVGVDPIGSIRMLLPWCLMALAAAVLGSSIAPERAMRTMLVVICAVLLLSALLALVLPQYGVQGGEGAHIWRGLFVGKNQLGWISALGLVVACNMYAPGYRRLPALTMLLAVLCLLGSGSKGSLVAALAALAYGYIVPRLMRHVTPGFGAVIVLTGALFMIICGALALPIIVELLGRDITLTGRTIIWKTYFMSMINTPWLGQGPGAYTAMSVITAVLAARLSDLGLISTPHNIYLGVLGDAGLFGLLTFVGLMVYMVLILPLYRRGPLWMLSGTIGFLIMADGLVETQQIFSAGPGWFLLMVVRALALHQDRLAPAESGQQRPRPNRMPGLMPVRQQTGY